jgi:signal transduction histidine kinase
LAMSQEIMRKLGGSISVESEPGHGAAFTMWLQVADSQLSRAPAATQSTIA